MLLFFLLSLKAEPQPWFLCFQVDLKQYRAITVSRGRCVKSCKCPSVMSLEMALLKTCLNLKSICWFGVRKKCPIVSRLSWQMAKKTECVNWVCQCYRGPILILWRIHSTTTSAVVVLTTAEVVVCCFNVLWKFQQNKLELQLTIIFHYRLICHLFSLFVD